MSERILVTGATGFIGSHLVQELVRKKYDVHCIIAPQVIGVTDIASEYQYLKGASRRKCDITDYYGIRGAIKKVEPDMIVHLAALTPVRDSFETPFSFVHANVTGTLNIAYALMEMPDFKRRKLIFASTAEVYGMQKVSPIGEDAILSPSSPYANTKAMADMQLRMMARVHGLNTTILRSVNSYGRKMDIDFFVEYVVTTMLRGEKVYIGAPESKRDYMYISDHVNAYVKVIEAGNSVKTEGQAFNVSTNDINTNKVVALKVAEMLGFDRKKIMLGEYPPGYPLRPLESDQPFIDLDSTKIRKALGWKPEVSLESGLKKTIAFWKEKIGK